MVEPTAKDRFTSLDTLAVARELRSLVRARVDKAFDLVGRGWSLQMRVPGEGRRELLLVPGLFAAVVPDPVDHAAELSPFAKELRRLLTGAVLRSVVDPAGERTLELEMTRGDDPDGLRVALELFGSGNLVVVHGTSLAAVAHPRRWAHRSVRIGAEYVRPPARADPWSLGAAEVTAELDRSRTDLTSTLAARLSLGGPVAEELIARLGVDGAASASPAARDLGPRLHAAMSSLRSDVGDPPSGFVYRRAGEAIDATPYASVRWSKVDGVGPEPVATFSQAAREYFEGLSIRPPSPAEVAAAETRRERERQRDVQRAAIAQLGREIEEARGSADWILAHYPEVEARLAVARRVAPDSRTVGVDVDGRTVELLLSRSPRQSAQAWYEEAKRLTAKQDGATAALAETDRALAAPRPLPPRGAGTVAPRTRRPHWFEKYRWFVSSEGVVAVAGRDASSNDLVVRRHLRPGDRYMHADLQGAASVVVKRPPAGAIGEATVGEAAQWAVAFSKAWRAGLAAASAFWVEADQVSKAGASGEFVARGAWVVHGTRNFVRDVPLELALGPIQYEADVRWTVAPERSLRSRGEVRYLLTPGEERDRAAVEVALANDLGLDRSLLQSLLPAGGLSARRA